LKLPRLARRLEKEVLGVPSTIQNVQADGNCFFRAVSLELTGAEESHHKIRESVVDFMKDKSAFEGYVGRPIADYLNESKMKEDRTWATDIEIVATATFLQSIVYVYGTYDDETKWLKHSPLFRDETIKMFGQCLYIVNAHNHFKRVVDVK